MALVRFTLRQLEIFAAVMRTGQVRAAAHDLHLSQSAVSQALHELSEAFDVKLFDRAGRTIKPTRAAERLLELSRGPRSELNALTEQLRGDGDFNLAGPIHIAASSTIAHYLLPALLANLAHEHPALHITLSSGNSAVVESRVVAGEVDLGFIEGPPTLEPIEARHWRTDRLEVIGPPSAPNYMEANQLGDWPWVSREAGSGTRAVFEQSLALSGLSTPTATHMVDDTGAQIRMVIAGAGLACVSRAAAESAAKTGEIRYVKLGMHALHRPLWSIQRKDRKDTQLAETLLAALSD